MSIDYRSQHRAAMEQIQSLFLRALNGDGLSPHQLAHQILHIIQQSVDSMEQQQSFASMEQQQQKEEEKEEEEDMDQQQQQQQEEEEEQQSLASMEQQQQQQQEEEKEEKKEEEDMEQQQQQEEEEEEDMEHQQQEEDEEVVGGHGWSVESLLEAFGWGLWEFVDDLARETRRNHHLLVAFINHFIPLLLSKPWQLWGESVHHSRLIMGPSFRENFQGAGPYAQDPPPTLISPSLHVTTHPQHDPAAAASSPPPAAATSEKLQEISDTTSDSVLLSDSERRIRRWCNFCRFVALVTRDTQESFDLYLLWIAREALEAEEHPDPPEAAIPAFEEVIDVCGNSMFQWSEEFGRAGSSRSGPWTGFCKERWMFWEDALRGVASDAAAHSRARASALRTLARMEAIHQPQSSSCSNSTPPVVSDILLL